MTTDDDELADDKEDEVTCQHLTALLEWHRLANTRGDSLQVIRIINNTIEGLRLRINAGEESFWLKWNGVHWTR